MPDPADVKIAEEHADYEIAWAEEQHAVDCDMDEDCSCLDDDEV